MPPQIKSSTQSAHLIPDLVVQGASTSPPIQCALVCADEWTLRRLPVRSGTRPIRLVSILEFFPIMALTLPKATLEVNSTGVMSEGLSGGRQTSPRALGWRFLFNSGPLHQTVTLDFVRAQHWSWHKKKMLEYWTSLYQISLRNEGIFRTSSLYSHFFSHRCTHQTYDKKFQKEFSTIDA